MTTKNPHGLFNEAVIEEGKVFQVNSLTHEDTNGKSFLYGRRYFQKNEPKWRMVFLHDIGEHSNRYHDYFLNFLKYFSKKNAPAFEIVSFDFKGHGKSGGTRGHLDSIDDLCLDTIMALNEPGKGELPTIMMGLGLGCIVSLKIYHHYFSKLNSSIDALVLINPGLKLNWTIPSSIESIARGGSLLFSKLKLPFQLEGRLFAGESLVAEEFDCDPLVNHTMTLGSLFELQHNASVMRTSAYYLDIPVFIGISGQGRLYSKTITELFAKGIVHSHVQHFPDAEHDLFHHFDCENFNHSVYNWLKKHKFLSKGSS